MPITAVADEALSDVPLLDVGLARLDVAIARLQQVEVIELLDDRLLDLVSQLAAATTRIQAVRLRALAQIETRKAACGVGATSTRGWLTAGGMRPSTAKREVELAAALLQFPATAEALADGRISQDHASVITTGTAVLPPELGAEIRARAEVMLLQAAEQLNPAELSKEAVRVATRLDPSAAGRLALSEQEAVGRRDLSIYRDQRNGMRVLAGRVDDEGAALIEQAVDHLSAPLPAGPQGRDERSPGRRRMDALVELARRYLTGGGATTGEQRPQVTVTMSLDQLQERVDGVAELIGVSRVPISARTARRIACDGKVIPILLGGRGEILDVGRASRTATPAIRRALEYRDKGCAFPGCDRPSSWAQAHHVVPWAQGGSTSLDNMVLLCLFHHDLAHAGWQVTINAAGQPEFRPPP